MAMYFVPPQHYYSQRPGPGRWLPDYYSPAYAIPPEPADLNHKQGSQEHPDWVNCQEKPTRDKDWFAPIVWKRLADT